MLYMPILPLTLSSLCRKVLELSEEEIRYEKVLIAERPGAWREVRLPRTPDEVARLRLLKLCCERFMLRRRPRKLVGEV